MKKLLKGFLYFVVACAIIGVIIGYMIGTFPAFTFVARTFLVAVSNNQYAQAYSLLSPDFQARNNLSVLENNVRLSGLDQYKSAQWGKENILPNKKSGNVIAKVLTNQNKTIIVEFQFINIEGKEPKDRGWRIDNITFPKPE
ncbi:MAG: hypothetical protein JSS07_00275 [Proteobacteria bacterium]|nr:hypothetical protein [Pseudomonadota bacterium]